MKLHVVFALLCAVLCTEAFRVARDTEAVTSSTEVTSTSTTAAQQECCYPKPPRARKFKMCCEIPTNEIFPKFDADLHACKDKKNEAETTTTTTAAPPPEDEEDEGADIENLVDSDASVEGSDEEQSSKTPEKAGRSHGKGTFRKHHGHSGRKCLKTTMEKRGWVTNGTVNWETIIEEIEEGKTEGGKQWGEIMKGAVEACRPLAYLQPGYVPNKEGKKHKNKPYNIGKVAWRCMKNNAVINCPNFPTEDSYCVALKDVHQRCGARKQPGQKPIPWCKPRNRKVKSHMKA